jgi:hypothetical protein
MTSSAPSHTTQTSEVKLPEWVDQAGQENYQLAQLLGEQKFQQYKGDRVADVDPMMLKAQNYLQNGLQKSTQAYGRASNLFDKISDFKLHPEQVTMGSLADTNLQPYMNKYTGQVVDKSMEALNDSRLQSLMGNADAAQAAGAFGGSRHGIVDAVTNSETAKNAGLLSSQLYSNAFTNAQQAAQSDIAGKYTSDLANRDSGIQAQLARLQGMQTGATGLMSAADASNAARQQNYTDLMQGGLFNQQQRQREIDSDMQKFGEKRDYDLQNLNLRLSALGMSPYGKTQNTDTVSSPATSGTDWFTGGLGIMSLLLSL